jgi:hypothetical protein
VIPPAALAYSKNSGPYSVPYCLAKPTIPSKFSLIPIYEAKAKNGMLFTPVVAVVFRETKSVDLYPYTLAEPYFNSLRVELVTA